MTPNDKPAARSLARARAAAGRAKRALKPADTQPIVERLNRQHERIAATERDLARIGPQVAALEMRLDELRQRVEAPNGTLDEASAASARSIIEEVRREHEQVRARISAAVRYEERLQQLERRVAALTGEG